MRILVKKTNIMLVHQKSQLLFQKAQQLIPGGVNSPVRAFRAVGGKPIFMRRAKGAYLYDEDGNRYIDLIGSWGPMLLGHAHPEIVVAVMEAAQDSLSFGTPSYREIDIAELIIQMMPSIQKVRMVNSGTEATMSAIRVARGYTNREKIIKFEGCYHGHGDSFLIAAGSGAMTMGTPDSLGVTKGTAQDTLTAPFNDLAAVQTLVDANPQQIAAIIVEPVAGNMGCVLPNKGFLEGLRSICDQNGIVLIFDEVMTGFRLAKGGAQEVFGVHADLTTLGKIIGGGMPVGAYGGKAEIMNSVSPAGKVYQAGTLSGNPVAMAAGLATLRHIDQNPALYLELNRLSERLKNGIAAALADQHKDYTLTQMGSMFTLFFTNKKVENFADAKTADVELFAKYFQYLLHRGIYLPPSQFESWFLSVDLRNADIDHIISVTWDFLKTI